MRIYDLEEITAEEYYEVRLAQPFEAAGDALRPSLDEMQAWIDLHCEGEYVMLLKTVIFNHEPDAFIFRLKYGV